MAKEKTKSDEALALERVSNLRYLQSEEIA
jgi:hypothetical protein